MRIIVITTRQKQQNFARFSLGPHLPGDIESKVGGKG